MFCVCGIGIGFGTLGFAIVNWGRLGVDICVIWVGFVLQLD